MADGSNNLYWYNGLPFYFLASPDDSTGGDSRFWYHGLPFIALSEPTINTNYSAAGVVTIPTNTNDLAYIYTNADRINMQTLDNSYVSVSGSTAIHQYKVQLSGSGAFSVQWTGTSSVATTISTAYLQLWNITTGQWENAATNVTTNANVEFSLISNKSAGVAGDYIDADDIVIFRVWQAGGQS